MLYVGLIGLLCQVVSLPRDAGSSSAAKLTDLGLFPARSAGSGSARFGYPSSSRSSGLALAGLFRSVPAAIVILLLYPAHRREHHPRAAGHRRISILVDIGKLLPFTAGQQIIRYSGSTAATPTSTTASQAPWTGALTFMRLHALSCWPLCLDPVRKARRLTPVDRWTRSPTSSTGCRRLTSWRPATPGPSRPARLATAIWRRRSRRWPSRPRWPGWPTSWYGSAATTSTPLLELGAALREATATLSGDDLRRLDRSAAPAGPRPCPAGEVARRRAGERRRRRRSRPHAAGRAR